MTSALVADSIGKSFRGRPVLAGAYFAARAGEVTAIVGRNGCGKSTLFRICAGWTRADYGSVEVSGQRFLSVNPSVVARLGLVYLPVDHPILSPGFTLAQHLDVVEDRFGRSDRRAILERLAIAELEKVPTRALSGGERRRAELALALVRRPTCFLADEPFQGITPSDADLFSTVLRGMAEAGAAVALTGHETTFIFNVADRVLWLDQGTIRDLGSPAEAVADWRFRRDYLGLAAAPGELSGRALSS